MTTTFETAKVCDRVWSVTKGWGEIIAIDDKSSYPLSVKFDCGMYDTFDYNGYLAKTHIRQSIFWDEVKIEAPQKPLPDLAVDTKVIVWNSVVPKTKRHFSHFSPEGKIVCFDKGLTSWTSDGTSEWSKWELAE